MTLKSLTTSPVATWCMWSIYTSMPAPQSQRWSLRSTLDLDRDKFRCFNHRRWTRQHSIASELQVSCGMMHAIYMYVYSARLAPLETTSISCFKFIQITCKYSHALVSYMCTWTWTWWFMQQCLHDCVILSVAVYCNCYMYMYIVYS